MSERLILSHPMRHTRYLGTTVFGQEMRSVNTSSQQLPDWCFSSTDCIVQRGWLLLVSPVHCCWNASRVLGKAPIVEVERRGERKQVRV